MTAVRSNLRSLEDHLVLGDASGREKLIQMIDDVSKMIQQLNTIVDDLYPEGVDSSGLATAIGRYVRRLGITVHLDIPYKRWPNRVERTAFFVISEALTNVAKHARVSEASVVVSDAAEVLDIEVTDSGIGMTAASDTVLTSLRARVVALGGTLTIDSGPGRGTPLRCSLPLWIAPNARPTLIDPVRGTS